MSLKAELGVVGCRSPGVRRRGFRAESRDFLCLSSFLLAPPPTCPSYTLSQSIADSSKILTNMGLIYATLGEHETAVQQFIAATRLDNYLAVASVPLPP